MNETLICKNCGEKLEPNWQLCPVCETPMTITLNCRNCDTELKPHWKACPVCKMPVSESIAVRSRAAEPLAPPPSESGPVPEGFVYVEGGTFIIGSPETEEGRNDKETQHQVTVSGFYMGKYEVTQDEWWAVMGSSPSRFKGDTLPVEKVSWYEAVEYCNRRSQKEGLTPMYSGSKNSGICDWNANGYRLPTEAEWEYAAKGGNKGPVIYGYIGSNEMAFVAWYKGNSGNTTHPVGTKNANPLGIYDMNGNVWEWCWDWYSSYKGGAQTDPRGASPEYARVRVKRGGSWRDSAGYVRSACRDSGPPCDRHSGLGFRLARSR